MGRAPKYLTHSARTKAKRAQHAKYSKSDRGRAAQARYLHKRNHPPPTSVAITAQVHIPDVLQARALKRIAISWSFRESDGPDLGLRRPPYIFTIPDAETIALVEDTGDDPLDLKLHTLQCTWVRAERSARLEAWSALGLDQAQVVESGIQELEARIRAWLVLARDARWTKLGTRLRDVYLDWGAKRVVWLAEELEQWRQGRDAYVAAFPHLPAQVSYSLEEHPDDDEEENQEEEEEEEDLFAEKYE